MNRIGLREARIIAGDLDHVDQGLIAHMMEAGADDTEAAAPRMEI